MTFVIIFQYLLKDTFCSLGLECESVGAGCKYALVFQEVGFIVECGQFTLGNVKPLILGTQLPFVLQINDLIFCNQHNSKTRF